MSGGVPPPSPAEEGETAEPQREPSPHPHPWLPGNLAPAKVYIAVNHLGLDNGLCSSWDTEKWDLVCLSHWEASRDKKKSSVLGYLKRPREGQGPFQGPTLCLHTEEPWRSDQCFPFSSLHQGYQPFSQNVCQGPRPGSRLLHPWRGCDGRTLNGHSGTWVPERSGFRSDPR